MSTRLAAFLLASSTLVGCSTVNQAVDGAKQDWARMTGSGQTAQTADQTNASTPPASTHRQVGLGATGTGGNGQSSTAAANTTTTTVSVVHPRLEAAVAKYGAENKTGKGQPDPVSFNSGKCSTELLTGQGPSGPLNRNSPTAVQRQAENAGWGAVAGAAARLPGVLGNAAGRTVQTTRDTQGAQADATQRLCGRFGAANVQYMNADQIADPKRRETTFANLDRTLAANFVRQVAAADSSTRAILNRGTDQVIEGAGREILNKVYTPKSQGGVIGDLINKIPGVK